MILFPAVDIKGAKCVRLRQGLADQETCYGDPVEMARHWEAEGARWLHVIDLDGSFDGKPVNLLDFLRENRAGMVLKPVGLFGGKNVAIGHEMSDREWQEALETAVKERYVAQEYIPIPEISLPVYDQNGLRFENKKVNINFFAFNGVYAGGMARVSDSSIINISAGGGLIPLMAAAKR